MIESGAPTNRPPTGSTGTDVHSDAFLHELRRGDREAFARYFEMYRAPVYSLVTRLLHDAEVAVSLTEEVFTRVYRRILLHDGPLDLRGSTYGAAIDVCRERPGEREADRDAESGREADRREPSGLGRRFAQALETTEFRHQAALLLHDVDGLRPAEMATAFGVTEDAAGALLFRAREEFRRAFEELSSDRRASTCRLVEETAAGAVGRGLSDDEVRRLEAHAGYCRECRLTMAGWGAGAVGLGLFLEDAPLPEALATTPVFGTAIAITGASSAVAGSLTRKLAQVGRLLTSRAAAYALAAACLAVSVGLAVQQSPGDRAFILVPATAARGPAFVKPVASVVRPPISRNGPSVATSGPSVTGSPVAVESRAGATGPTVTVVADVGLFPGGARLAVSRSAASAAEGAAAVTPKGDAKGDAKTSKAERGSDSPGRSGEANGNHAQSAVTHPGNSATHAQDGRYQHAKKAEKGDAAKRQKRTKTKNDR